jgi:phospholipase/carboxylesterase
MRARITGAGLALATLVVCPVASVAQEASAASGSVQEVETFWQEVPSLVPVRVFLPSDDRTGDAASTMVVALHGFGSAARSWTRIASQLAEAGFIVAVPESPHAFLSEEGGLGFDWSLYHVGDPELDARAYEVLATGYMPRLIRSLSERYSPEATYLLGHSQGAIASILAGIYNHESLDGVITFGLGAYDPAWFQDPQLAPAFEAGNHLSILLVHGDDDDRVPLTVSERGHRHLTEHGYSVTLKPFKGGHTVPSRELDFVIQWLRSIESRTPSNPR